MTLFDLKMIVTLSVCCTIIAALVIIIVCLIVKPRQMALSKIQTPTKNSIKYEAPNVNEEAVNEPYDFLEMYQIYDDELHSDSISVAQPGLHKIPGAPSKG